MSFGIGKYFWYGMAGLLLMGLLWAGGEYFMAQDGKREHRGVVRVAVLPDQDPAQLREQHQPLVEYLAEKTGRSFKLIIPASYEELINLVNSGEIEFAYFGALTFLQAVKNKSVVPLAMRNIDLRFTSYFLVRADSPGKTLRDFQGKKFGFGSRSSTSGHLMPRKFLVDEGIHAESFFSEVRYSGNHDKTARWVADGTVDLGVANSQVIKRMVELGHLRPGTVRVLWESPPYADYVWAARKSLGREFRGQVLDAILALSQMEKRHRLILERQSAGHFLPATMEDFSHLRKMAHNMGLL